MQATDPITGLLAVAQTVSSLSGATLLVIATWAWFSKKISRHVDLVEQKTDYETRLTTQATAYENRLKEQQAHYEKLINEANQRTVDSVKDYSERLTKAEGEVTRWQGRVLRALELTATAGNATAEATDVARTAVEAQR